jgi:hypothetical protein
VRPVAGLLELRAVARLRAEAYYSEDRSRFAEYRDRLRGGPARVLKPCGTLAAARRHQRKGEPACKPCKAALAEHARNQYAKRKK